MCAPRITGRRRAPGRRRALGGPAVAQARGSQASAGQGRVPVCSPSPALRLVFGLGSALGDLWVTRDRISRRLAPLVDPTPGPAPAMWYLWALIRPPLPAPGSLPGSPHLHPAFPTCRRSETPGYPEAPPQAIALQAQAILSSSGPQLIATHHSVHFYPAPLSARTRREQDRQSPA